ncbi:hypothetical protein Anapl_17840 [Anas platyrhynchos]|uniref:Uncharacterized protein n=1 Tax=Anas platyrhynchos TaxID=8839 RepID=R0KTI0_ANAPL|nr:hypothetical protein Anapl_17840 [Anas platyrhynchos]
MLSKTLLIFLQLLLQTLLPLPPPQQDPDVRSQDKTRHLRIRSRGDIGEASAEDKCSSYCHGTKGCSCPASTKVNGDCYQMLMYHSGAQANELLKPAIAENVTVSSKPVLANQLLLHRDGQSPGTSDILADQKRNKHLKAEVRHEGQKRKYIEPAKVPGAFTATQQWQGWLLQALLHSQGCFRGKPSEESLPTHQALC